MEPDYSNHTLYSLKSPIERYLWFTYQLLIVLLSLVGDTLILLGSERYNAFNLHKVLVGIIEHLAVADMVYSVATVAPIAVTLAADRWVLGDFLCHVLPYVGHWSYVCIIWFTAALTVAKNLLLKYPFRARDWGKHHAHRICFLCWGLSLSVPLTVIMMDIRVDYRVYNCSAYIKDGLQYWMILILSNIFGTVPSILMFICTMYLIYQAVKIAARRSTQRETVKWQGILTVIITAIIYCFGSLPYSLYYSLGGLFSEDNATFHVTYHRTAMYIASLNVAANFFVNVATVTSFRNFVKHKVLRVPVPEVEVTVW